MSSSDKPIVLAFVGHYLPGYKAGGIMRGIVNTVDHLCDEFDFRIVTRDRDIGDDHPYTSVRLHEWQKVGNATVCYLPPESDTLRQVLKVILNTPHHVLYLNSFFESFTIKALFNRIFYRSAYKPVIVAPWGEFAWASLSQKYPKKWLFILVARLIGLYKDLTWRASSEFEMRDIIRVMKVAPESIQIAGDFPIKHSPAVITFGPVTPSPNDHEDLRLVFLSRISREKNLDTALRILRRVTARVVYDIYGPTENEAYWQECQELIGHLPSNVTVRYLGVVRPDQVVNIFGGYDLFLFPTGGEAYGHVIAECLTSGTPVLISTETPWRNLESDGFGWDIDLERIDRFVEVIEECALRSREERLKSRAIIKAKIMGRLLDPVVLESNRQLLMRS